MRKTCSFTLWELSACGMFAVPTRGTKFLKNERLTLFLTLKLAPGGNSSMSMLQPKSISCNMTELSGVSCTRKLSGLISAWIILTPCMADTTRSMSMQKWSANISFMGRPNFCLIAFATSSREPHGLKSDISTDDWSSIYKQMVL